MLRLFFLFMLTTSSFAAEYPSLNNEQQAWLGQQIFNNECAGQIDCLTSWNPGETFPSLGIGHFIWYQADQNEIYEESFPQLMSYFTTQNITIPDWIIAAGFESPWLSREAFLADYAGPELSELRHLLASTMPQQTAFIIQRFEAALNKILATLSSEETSDIEEKFYAVANTHTPYGLYAMIDYVNFKGEGVAPDEQYAGQGWGLLQVLQGMSYPNEPILNAFVASAKQVLQKRVNNAATERNEARWLPGWFRRLESYLPPEQ